MTTFDLVASTCSSGGVRRGQTRHLNPAILLLWLLLSENRGGSSSLCSFVDRVTVLLLRHAPGQAGPAAHPVLPRRPQCAPGSVLCGSSRSARMPRLRRPIERFCASLRLPCLQNLARARRVTHRVHVHDCLQLSLVLVVGGRRRDHAGLNILLRIAVDVLPQVLGRKGARVARSSPIPQPLPMPETDRPCSSCIPYRMSAGMQPQSQRSSEFELLECINIFALSFTFGSAESGCWASGFRRCSSRRRPGRSCSGHAYSHAPQPTQRLGSTRGCFRVFVLPAESITWASST